MLGVSRGGIVRHETLDVAAFDALVARRAARALATHLQPAGPRSVIEVDVGPGVFVPRPETEVTTGAAIEVARML